ncbi:kynurenine 3-monooxygenase-like [Oppia nitens]|uniref:kynurenine 3-monooxygenase-like n=1 Tax=Oppia nitens TaxID=1686743 RepID=UPI0023DAA14A|nr:kynurenine 3-monooxygenase-like [Oppia nitens]
MDSIAVVGGGLVGSMAACFLARKGYHVDVYEMRDDPRTQEQVVGKSINMALSERGRSALRSLGLETQILENYSIKMFARLIHDVSGRKRAIPYGTNRDQYLLSISRRYLNELMLTEVEKFNNISVNFRHKLVGANLDEGKMTFLLDDDKQRQRHQKADIIIGCDGAFSSVRRAMVKLIRFNYSQQYIEHGYIELSIPPRAADGQYAMEVNYLHIWPRGSFMMIALPNLDHSFTVTLFMPFRYYESILDRNDLLNFFKQYFPDSIPLIGEEELVKVFFANSPQPLISIKCQPYNYLDKVLLMGDAAHAMVPFFGQGMNCGFEDCLILDELLTANNNNLRKVLPVYSDQRLGNCHTIIDLAMDNYVEMRDLVNSRTFLVRKQLDRLLNWVFPRHWIPLYSMVTFTRIPYQQCIQDRRWQDRVIARCQTVSIVTFLCTFLYVTYRTGKLNLLHDHLVLNFQ